MAGLKPFDNPKKKTWCYEGKCGPIIQTGFHTGQFYSCSKCKEEVTEAMYLRNEQLEKAIKEDADLQEALKALGY